MIVKLVVASFILNLITIFYSDKKKQKRIVAEKSRKSRKESSDDDKSDRSKVDSSSESEEDKKHVDKSKKIRDSGRPGE